MNKARQAAKDIHISDNAGSGSSAKGGIHPLARLIVTFIYIILVVSFPSYDLAGLAGMFIYLLVNGIWYGISAKPVLKRAWPVFLVAILAGSAGLVTDREVYITYSGITITYGMLGVVTLVLKGMFCITASYILSVTASAAQICHALRLIHVPEEIVMVILLMHRYLIVLIKEVERMQQAYKLRAPGRKGIQFKNWGSFAGLLLLRSMDRAEEVYESMKLRGFHGSLKYPLLKSGKRASILYVFLWGIFLFIFRFFPVFQIAGSLL